MDNETIEEQATQSHDYWRERYDRTVVPHQKEVIASLTVDSLENKIGVPLATAIQVHESRQNIFIDEYGRQATETLEQYSPGASISQVQIENGDGNRRYLITKSQSKDNNTQYVEIFELLEKDGPFNMMYMKDRYSLKYKHDLVINKQNGMVADLLDLVPEDSDVILYFGSERTRYYGNNIKMSRNIDDEDNPFGVGETTIIGKHDSSTMAHEAGHVNQNVSLSSQRSIKDRFHDSARRIAHRLGRYYYLEENTDKAIEASDEKKARDVGRRVVNERNAHAFALGVIRKYRQLGVNIMPSYTNKQIIQSSNYPLETYDEAATKRIGKLEKLKFSKVNEDY